MAAGGVLTLEAHAADMNLMAERLSRPVAPLMKRLSLVLVSDTKTEVFAKGQSPDGATWAPLKFARLRTGGNDLPLRDTGILMNSLTGSGKGSERHVERLSGSTLIWGTNADYALIHQRGGTITPKGHPFLAIPATKEAKYVGSARQFPRPLEPIIGKKGGVLAETKVVKGTAAIRKQIASTTKRARAAAKKVSGKGLSQSLMAKVTFLRKRLSQKIAQAQVVQYYLARKVTVPARPFIGFGNRLADKVLQAVSDYYYGTPDGRRGGL